MEKEKSGQIKNPMKKKRKRKKKILCDRYFVPFERVSIFL